MRDRGLVRLSSMHGVGDEGGAGRLEGFRGQLGALGITWRVVLRTRVGEQ